MSDDPTIAHFVNTPDEVRILVMSHEKRLKALEVREQERKIEDAPRKWLTGKVLAGIGAAITTLATMAVMMLFGN